MYYRVSLRITIPSVVYNGKYYEALTLASLVWSTFRQSPFLFTECVYLHATRFLIRFYRWAAHLLLPLATQVAPWGSVSFLIGYRWAPRERCLSPIAFSQQVKNCPAGCSDLIFSSHILLHSSEWPSPRILLKKQKHSDQCASTFWI